MEVGIREAVSLGIVYPTTLLLLKDDKDSWLQFIALQYSSSSILTLQLPMLVHLCKSLREATIDLNSKNYGITKG